MAITAERISEDVEELREKIGTSKELAKDVEEFCDEITESLKNGLEIEALREEADKEILLEVIDSLVENEPDVTLRAKLKSLLEICGSYSHLERHTILLKL